MILANFTYNFCCSSMVPGSFVVFGSEANEQCKSLAAACGSIFIRSCRLSTQTLLERFLDCASRLGAMVFFEGVERFSPSLLRSLISQLKKRSVDRKGMQSKKILRSFALLKMQEILIYALVFLVGLHRWSNDCKGFS